ncbi:MAG: hypothetical protein GXX84_15950 [Acidobacteria bacterium]|nr:hypothetical protein [Acidobacteriota bacterium]
MNQLLKTIAAISETHNPALKILVLTTMFNKRQNLDKIIRQQVGDFFGPSLVLESRQAHGRTATVSRRISWFIRLSE